MKKIISTTKAPGAIGPYSQGIATEGLVYTSGQLPIDMTTGELQTDIKLATKACLENVKAILEEAGLTMDNIIKTTVFMKDMGQFVDMNEVYASFFQSNPPARSAVQVAALPKDAVIEIEVVAAK
ncbi:MAG: RidA family protein [Filifactoraceae bacterium]